MRATNVPLNLDKSGSDIINFSVDQPL